MRSFPVGRIVLPRRHSHARLKLFALTSWIALPTVLVYQLYIAATPLAPGVKQGACAALAAGIIFQSGGFFWRAFVGPAGKHVTRAGAFLLDAAMIVLIGGLFT